jgi:hypothetical protein
MKTMLLLVLIAGIVLAALGSPAFARDTEMRANAGL